MISSIRVRRLRMNSTAEDEATGAELTRSCSKRSPNPSHATADQNRSTTRQRVTQHTITHAGDTTDRMQTRDDLHDDDTISDVRVDRRLTIG
jgi:hypothetical protein